MLTIPRVLDPASAGRAYIHCVAARLGYHSTILPRPRVALLARTRVPFQSVSQNLHVKETIRIVNVIARRTGYCFV